MMAFIFNNLIWNGRVADDSFDRESFINNVLYPNGESRINNNELIFTRSKIGKHSLLSAKKVAEINFPVDFSFEFEKKYVIKQESGKWTIN